MIAILDYGRGNIFSIANALKKLEVEFKIEESSLNLKSYDKIILPGVGAFKDAMEQLDNFKFTETIKEFASKEKPILGICLGMQILASKSYEYGETIGLDLIEGEVKALPNDNSLKVPNIGWRKLILSKKNKRQGLEAENMMYFVHSYGFYANQDSNIIAKIKFGTHDIAAIVKNKNILGCQFHPEKSGVSGLRLLNWFCKDFKG